MPNIDFEVERIEPKFWKNELLFTYLAATLKDREVEGIVKLNSALKLAGNRVTIEGISYTPRYELRELTGRLLDIGYVNLANFAPGTVDTFRIPGYPYKIHVSIYPDIEFKNGKIGTKTMNLNNPRFLLKITRGKFIVFSGLLGLNDEAYFDGLGLSFPEIKYNGVFRVIRDPGEWLIWMALILMVAGLIWKLLFYRREIAVGILGDKIYLCLNSDYYPALLLRRYRTILEAGSAASYSIK